MTDAALANVITYSAQVLFVVAAAAVAALLVRLPMARARVAYWRLVLAACLALPLLTRPADRIVFVAPASVGRVPAAAVVDTTTVAAEPAAPPVAEVVKWLLLAGVAARAVWLGVGILALIRLRRRSVVASLADDVDVLRKAVAPTSAIRFHASIDQPVAFGWLRPVVVLPQRLLDLPLDAQRAVVCHELLHVARHDWLWMLGEEAIRCVLWFHPAIWFALEKLQLSREELVDEEVVRITGVRQPYVRALAMFAGEPAAFAAATPFIRRRHFVSRIRQLSEEHTMSRLRIACGFVVLLVLIGASAWGASSAMPLRIDGTMTLPLPSAAVEKGVSLPPVEGVVTANVTRNQDAAASQLQESLEERAATLKKLADAFAAVQAEQQRAISPPLTLHVGAQSVTPWSTLTYRVGPVYPEAAKGHGVEAVVTVLVFVGTGGEVTSVEARRTRLTTERDVTDPTFWASQPSRLFGQAAEDAVRQWRWEPGAVRRFEIPVAFGEQDRTAFVPAAGVRVAGAANGIVSYTPATRLVVGGGVQPPALVSKVEAVYPAAAKVARVEGVVIIEAVIATDGSVREAWVARSIPLLDQAALDAVRQWRYQPVLLNGVPVEVSMTMAVNFVLPQ